MLCFVIFARTDIYKLVSFFVQVQSQGFSEFSGLRSSSASLPFARKSSEDLFSVIAFQTSAVSFIFPLICLPHLPVRTTST